MYDMHYDLLTFLYINFKKNNKFSNDKKCVDYLKRIYSKGNIKGGIVNLYFMSKEEMLNELDITYQECLNVYQMFKDSIQTLESLKNKNIIPKEIDFLYSIEGCDFITSPSELEKLYSLGLRSILLVWNNNNKYGSGYKTDKGLTDLGKAFIKKAIDLGIIIDISHANENTFNDIIKIVQEYRLNGKNPIVIASHSNCKSLCNRQRNLNDEQLLKLKHVDGYIGLFSNSRFLASDLDNETKEIRKKHYINHINHILELGYSENRILLSTDDMNFNPDNSYHNLETFDLEHIKLEIESLLKEHYKDSFIKKLMCENAIELFNKIRYEKGE